MVSAVSLLNVTAVHGVAPGPTRVPLTDTCKEILLAQECNDQNTDSCGHGRFCWSRLRGWGDLGVVWTDRGRLSVLSAV